MSSRAISCLRYHDAPTMIGWLERVFGFARGLVVEDGRGGVAHAQLTLGGGMVMLGSARADAFGALQSTPRTLGGATTQSVYLVHADPDAVLARAIAEGAQIVRPLAATDYGSREFSLRDPEGHLWSVGTYDPWKAA